MNRQFIITLLVAMLFLVTACTSPQKDEPSEEEDKNTEQVDQGPSNDDKSASMEEEPDEFQLPNESLQKMDQGEAVQLLQEGLIKIGYSIDITSTYDDHTTWAITDLQLQENIDTTGMYNDETKRVIEDVFAGNKNIKQGEGLPKPAMEQVIEDGIKHVENPYEILALVNKQHALPADYIPHDLVIPNVRFPFTEDLPKKQLRKVAAKALEKMFEAGDKAGVDLFAQSGYRSYDRQDAIYAANVGEHGEEAANNFSAKPGESEHQSGLTMDITSPDVDYLLNIDFGQTSEGKWIQEHASEFGFIIRYPEEKENITQYQYEPWHLRYVGEKAAKTMVEKNLTLEEYLGVK